MSAALGTKKVGAGNRPGASKHDFSRGTGWWPAESKTQRPCTPSKALPGELSGPSINLYRVILVHGRAKTDAIGVKRRLGGLEAASWPVFGVRVPDEGTAGGIQRAFRQHMAGDSGPRAGKN